jgi:hypothetical protein
MLKKLLFFLIFILSFQAKSQNTLDFEQIEDNSMSTQFYTKCFENLNHGYEILKKYPVFKDVKLCSLMYCMMLLGYDDKEIQKIGEGRLIGIATQLYNEGNPVILVMGMNSYNAAQNKNNNLDDDDHIVYVSYGECTNPAFLINAAKIVNQQTMKLINKK